DYDSLWALESTAFGWEVEFEDLVSRIYTVFRRAGIGVEFVDPDESLSSYEMVVAPNLFVATSALAKKLKVFAHDGGVFVTAAPAGYKDRSCTALDSPPPGPLTELLGVEITEHDILGDNMTNRIEPQGEEREFDVDGFCSVLKLRGAESLARYTSQFYSGTPAVTECESGAGQVLFTGAALQGDGWEWFLSRALERAGVAPERWASEDVEVVRMKNEEGEERLFVLNHAGEPRELTLGDDETVTDLLEGERYEGAVRMEPYGVALFNV
ncbi:MAG: beta-galactosidase trimerization domain-containing protein, partial [Planctomycetota bacterium]